MNCDDCKHYEWYYDRCRKWDCEVDAREVHNCFERRETPVRDAMTTTEKYEKLDEMIEKYGGVNLDEEFDLTMYAFVMNNIDELQSKGYQIKCHDGAFGYGYVSVKI